MADRDTSSWIAVEPVGASWARHEARAKVRGEFKYTADVPIGPHLNVALHRSMQPSALLKSIDTSEAAAFPGVEAVFTGNDLLAALGESVYTGPAFADQPPLAIERVRYVGEPVVAVLSRDEEAAREATSLVRVEYEPLTAVYDVDDALNGVAYVHDRLKPAAIFGDLRHLKNVTDTNVCYEYNLHYRDDIDMSGEAAYTASGHFWSPPVHHVPIELPFTSASFSGDCLEIWTTTQTPSYVREMASQLLNIPLSQVRVRTMPLGGGFGSKMYDRLEPLASALAWMLKGTVRIAVTREEAFILTSRHGVRVDSSMSVSASGNMVSSSADIAYDTGAYADIGPRMTGKSGSVSLGPYRIEQARIRSRCVYTNKTSAGAFRGFGVPQVTFSHESLVDDLARARGEDPVEFRMRNLLREGDVAYIGTQMHSANFTGCLMGVAEALEWHRPLPPSADPRWVRGRGVAVGIKAVLTPTVANATIQFNQDNSATLMISTVDMGQGSDTIMAQIVAEELFLGEHQIRVVHPDTDVTPYDTITAGSRSTYHTGNAVRSAAEQVREEILDIAARHAKASRADLKMSAGQVLNTRSQESMSVEDLMLAEFGARGATITKSSNFTTQWQPYDKATGRSERVTEHWFAGAAGAQILVDTKTGRVHIEHLAVAGDVGRAINPRLVEQQLCGAAIMGMGIALFEEMVFDHGQITNGTLLDYQLPSIQDMPDKLTPIIIESPHRTGPFGAKGVGETGLLTIAPAIANAIRDAVGVRVTGLPLSPEKVFHAMESAGVAQ